MNILILFGLNTLIFDLKMKFMVVGIVLQNLCITFSGPEFLVRTSMVRAKIRKNFDGSGKISLVQGN